MKYLVFAGTKYYPAGGWEDFREEFDSLDAATGWCRGYCAAGCLTWAHVMCLETREVVFAVTSDE